MTCCHAPGGASSGARGTGEHDRAVRRRQHERPVVGGAPFRIAEEQRDRERQHEQHDAAAVAAPANADTTAGTAARATKGTRRESMRTER